MRVALVIPGPPTAKGRPRISTRGGAVRAYTPARTQRYEELVRLAAGEAMAGAAPVDTAVVLSITAFVAPPQSMSKRRMADALGGLVLPITRPDADNYAKAALDGCNAILFRDDALVTDLIVRKRYSDRPRLEIVMTLGGDA